jgi:hypothetical protein
MLRNNRGGAGHSGRRHSVPDPDAVCHSVRDGERGQEDQRGGGVEEEEDVMSIILAGPYGEVRHALASTSALASCILSRLATVACMTINEYFKW